MPRLSSNDSSNSSSRSISSSDNKYKISRPSRKETLPKKNILFISHLNPHQETFVIAAKLRELFSPKCTIQSLDVKTTQNGIFKFAFLELKQTKKIQKIIDQMNGKVLDGSRILVERHKSKRTDINPRNFIGLPNRGNCYRCNKPGHFIRECLQGQEYRIKERRQSTSRSRNHKKRHWSSSISDSHSSESQQKNYQRHKQAKGHRNKRASNKSDKNHEDRL